MIIRILSEGQFEVPDDQVDALVTSQLVLPHESATLAEVRDLLSGDGLIPG